MTHSSISRFEDGLSFDYLQTAFPSKLFCLKSPKKIIEDQNSYYFGIILGGNTKLKNDFGECTLTKDCYFALNGPFELSSSGPVVLIQRLGYVGLPHFGGKIEPHARLSYIDNCRASVLISPARLGDPVLNLLVFPPNVDQTFHVHPTVRLGAVVGGSGVCQLSDQESPLQPGDVFALNPYELHRFKSHQNGLTVIAYHPDSDVGPTDEVHPMLSRTFIQK